MTRRGRGRPPHPDILTPAEWRVLEELRTGGTYAEIAVRLGVSPDAIRFHVRNMRDKLNLRDRAELVAWRPPDGEQRRRFRALLAPLAGLPVAMRTVAGVGVAAAVAGGLVATLVLVVAWGEGNGSPPVVVVSEEPSRTPVPTSTPPATAAVATPLATSTPVATPITPGPAAASSPSPTSVAASEPTTETSATCATVPSIQDVFGFWATKPEYRYVPEMSRTPASRWIGVRPVSVFGPSTGIRVHRLIATGSVRGVERVESLSDGRSYLVLEIEVEDTLWGDGPESRVLNVLLDGRYDEELDWARVEGARQSLLCSRVLFANPSTASVPGDLAGVAPGELHRVSRWDIALGPRGDRFIDDLAEEFQLAAAQVQPSTCPLFSLGAGSDVAFARRARGIGATASGADAIVRGLITGVAGEAFLTEHVSPGALAERHLVFEVRVQTSFGGEVDHGDRLRLLLPVAAFTTPAHVASLLPCVNALLLLTEYTGDWLRVSLQDDGVPLYMLYEWGLYLETRGGSILNPYVSWASWDWLHYGPMILYGVNVQQADLAEFSAALR